MSWSCFSLKSLKILSTPQSPLFSSIASVPNCGGFLGALMGDAQAVGQAVSCYCVFSAGVLGIVPLEGRDGGKRTVSQLCCHSGRLGKAGFKGKKSSPVPSLQNGLELLRSFP